MRVGAARRGGVRGHQGTTRARRRTHTRSEATSQRAAPLSARLAVMRMSRGWALLLAVALGIVVAVVLICTVPLYTTLVGDVQLQRALGETSATGRNIQVQVKSSKVPQTPTSRIVSGRTPGAEQYKRLCRTKSTYYVVSDPMLLVQVGANFQPEGPTSPTSDVRLLRFLCRRAAYDVSCSGGAAGRRRASAGGG